MMHFYLDWKAPVNMGDSDNLFAARGRVFVSPRSMIMAYNNSQTGQSVPAPVYKGVGR